MRRGACARAAAVRDGGVPTYLVPPPGPRQQAATAPQCRPCSAEASEVAGGLAGAEQRRCRAKARGCLVCLSGGRCEYRRARRGKVAGVEGGAEKRCRWCTLTAFMQQVGSGTRRAPATVGRHFISSSSAQYQVFVRQAGGAAEAHRRRCRLSNGFPTRGRLHTWRRRPPPTAHLTACCPYLEFISSLRLALYIFEHPPTPLARLMPRATAKRPVAAADDGLAEPSLIGLRRAIAGSGLETQTVQLDLPPAPANAEEGLFVGLRGAGAPTDGG